MTTISLGEKNFEKLDYTFVKNNYVMEYICFVMFSKNLRVWSPENSNDCS